MKKYFQYLLIIFISSCASNEEVVTPKSYSDDTNRTFEMIERGGSYYLKKAPTYNRPPKLSAPATKRTQSPEPREEIVIDEKINYQNKSLDQEVKPTHKTEVLRPVLKNTHSTSKADERLIEINQNLAFYCMKHRKSSAYGGDEAKCMKHVNTVMINCQKQHLIVNSKLLNCIQKKLKK